MTGKGAAMVSSGDDRKNVVPPWLRPIGSIRFYRSCETHSSETCKFYCKVCMLALCKECQTQHDLPGHEIIMVYKFDKVPSFRIEDLEPLWDTSDICSYSRNRWHVVIINKRGDGIARPRGQNNGTECKSCQYRFKPSDAKYCSVECKVDDVMKMDGSGIIKNEAKRRVETKPEGCSSNAQSFRKRPRKQKNPQRAPLF